MPSPWARWVCRKIDSGSQAGYTDIKITLRRIPMPVFTVRSAMSKKDWRKFLFTATFRRNPKVLLSIDAVALLAAFLLSWDSVTGFSLMRLALFFVFLCKKTAASQGRSGCQRKIFHKNRVGELTLRTKADRM